MITVLAQSVVESVNVEGVSRRALRMGRDIVSSVEAAFGKSEDSRAIIEAIEARLNPKTTA